MIRSLILSLLLVTPCAAQVAPQVQAEEVCILGGLTGRKPPILRPAVEVQRPPTQEIQQRTNNNTNLTITQQFVSQVNQNQQALQQQIDGLRLQIAQLKKQSGAAGKDGLAGKDGKDGLAGKDGKDGKDGGPPTDAQVQQVVGIWLDTHKIEIKGKDGAQGPPGKFDLAVFDEDNDGVYEKLPPFYFRVVDPRGLWSTSTMPIHLGERLSLKLAPVTTGGVQGGIGAERDMPAPEQPSTPSQSGQPTQESSTDGSAT